MTAQDVPALLVSVLGDPALMVEGTAMPFPAGRPGRLLAALVLQRGRTLADESLIDLLWPDPPQDPRAAMHTTVRRLRQALGSAGRLVVRRPEGYALVRAGVVVDAEAFADGLRSAAADRDLPALEAALARWQVDPWGVHGPRLAAAEVAGLRRARDQGRELLAELLLRAGRVDEAIAEARALVAADPLRDGPTALLIRALDAAGDVAPALAAFDSHRRALADQLGLSPSRELTALHQRVLRREPGGAPPPAPAPPLRERLPVVPRLHGREAQVAALTSSLRRARCLTVVGPGGVGKTAIAAQLADGWPGPAWWVDLAQLQDGAEVLPALAQQVGAHGPGGSPLAALIRTLAGSRGLLVLDNCEHVLGEVADVVDAILTGAETVTVLTTSRERLGVVGETTFPLAPLQESPAVALFVERAAAVNPDLDFDAEALRDVAGLVAALDGLPLAIELAAGRSGAISFAELRERLAGHLELVRSASSRTHPRHRTLAATLDWSYRLLSASDQRVFRDLSVFAADFDLAAVEAVLGPAAVAATTDLVERSLLTHVSTPGRRSRYRMLVTVRAFAATRLGPDERDRIEAAHGRWTAALAERAAAGLEGPDEARWHAVVEGVLPDLSAAFARALALGDEAAAAGLASSLHRWAYFRVRPDVLAWSTRLLAARPEGWPAGVYLAAAAHAWMQGDPQDGLAIARKAVAAARDHGLTALEARGHESEGDLRLALGDLEEALQAYRRAERASAAAGHPADQLMAACGSLLALVWSGAPFTEQAALVADAQRVTDNPTARALSLYCLGEAWAGDDPERALGLLSDAIRLADAVGCALVTSVATTALTAVVTRLGSPDRDSLDRVVAAVDSLVSSGNENLLVTLLRNLVVLLSDRGQHAAVLELLATLAGHERDRPSWGAETAALRAAAVAARDALPAAAAAEAAAAGAGRSLAQAATEVLRELSRE